jgi:hypothetical protein
MYIEIVPNRNSRPAVLLREGWREGKKVCKRILLREGWREGKKVCKRTIANLTDWPAQKVSSG